MKKCPPPPPPNDGGSTTVTVIVTECESEPLVPVTVIMYVPRVVRVDVETVRVVVAVPFAVR